MNIGSVSRAQLVELLVRESTSRKRKLSQSEAKELMRRHARSGEAELAIRLAKARGAVQ